MDNNVYNNQHNNNMCLSHKHIVTPFYSGQDIF